MDGLHGALTVHAQSAQGGSSRAAWLAVLGALAGRRDVHGLVAGRVTRMLADAGELDVAVAARRLGAALSAGVPAAAKAHGRGGLAGGSCPGAALLLVHDRELLGVVDGWVASLRPAEFEEVLPLLRRTFGEFSDPERASIGRAVRALGGAGGMLPLGPGLLGRTI